jgi:hypothetical protein
MIFKTRIKDIADYDIGYVFNIGILKIRHEKISKVMEKPRYKTTIWIFGKQYEKI